jgi:hypothetical protein
MPIEVLHRKRSFHSDEGECPAITPAKCAIARPGDQAEPRSLGYPRFRWNLRQRHWPQPPIHQPSDLPRLEVAHRTHGARKLTHYGQFLPSLQHCSAFFPMIRVGRQLAKAGMTDCLPACVVGIEANRYLGEGGKRGN